MKANIILLPGDGIGPEVLLKPCACWMSLPEKAAIPFHIPNA